MARKRYQLIPNEPGVNVNQCSVCEQMDVTFGNQALGGVRFCETCFHRTLGWFQMNERERASLIDRFNRVRELPQMKAVLDLFASAPKERQAALLKAHAIGESRRRLADANRQEVE